MSAMNNVDDCVSLFKRDHDIKNGSHPCGMLLDMIKDMLLQINSHVCKWADLNS